MKDKVLIIGASGFLGRKLMPLFSSFSSKYEVIGTSNSSIQEGTLTVDITNPQQVQTAIEKVNPNIIILTAALANMDRCETERDLAARINVTGVENVVRYCQNRLLVFYSTDAVFDGLKGNYRENDPVNPMNFYAQTKLQGENLVKTLPDYLLLRTCMQYTDQKESPKFIPWLIRNLSQGKTVNVATDHIITITFIDDLAKATLQLIQKKCRGIYHVAGGSALSCYDMAIYIAQKWGFDKSLIHPVTRAQLPWKAARAEKATLNISKLRKEGISMLTFEQGMEKLWESSRGRNLGFKPATNVYK